MVLPAFDGLYDGGARFQADSFGALVLSCRSIPESTVVPRERALHRMKKVFWGVEVVGFERDLHDRAPPIAHLAEGEEDSGHKMHEVAKRVEKPDERVEGHLRARAVPYRAKSKRADFLKSL